MYPGLSFKGWWWWWGGWEFPPGYYEGGPRLLSKGNRGNIAPKETPSCLVSAYLQYLPDDSKSQWQPQALGFQFPWKTTFRFCAQTSRETISNNILVPWKFMGTHPLNVFNFSKSYIFSFISALEGSRKLVMYNAFWEWFKMELIDATHFSLVYES